MAYGNDFASAPSTVRDGDVSLALDRLSRASGAISDESGFYQQRLASVLSAPPPPSQLTGDAKDANGSCALAEQLNSLSRQLESAASSFAATRNRIEL